MENKDKLIFAILILLGLLNIASACYYFNEVYGFENLFEDLKDYEGEELSSFTEEEYVKFVASDCKNESLDKSAICVKGYISDIYNYSITKYKIADYEELIETGGDCKSWTRLYNLIGEEMEVITDKKQISLGEVNHIFSIYSNEEYYCIMDQLIVKCVKMSSSS